MNRYNGKSLFFISELFSIISMGLSRTFSTHLHLFRQIYLSLWLEVDSNKNNFMIKPIVKTIELGDGRTITLETGKLAKQADGSVMLRMGNTMLLATVCGAKDAVPGTDFMPLQVEYKEKFSAFGRFPGGFNRREGRASDYEILVCRLVDRALRPLFPDDYHADVFVSITLYSADGVDMPDALAGLAASAHFLFQIFLSMVLSLRCV